MNLMSFKSTKVILLKVFAFSALIALIADRTILHCCYFESPESL